MCKIERESVSFIDIVSNNTCAIIDTESGLELSIMIIGKQPDNKLGILYQKSYIDVDRLYDTRESLNTFTKKKVSYYKNVLKKEVKIKDKKYFEGLSLKEIMSNINKHIKDYNITCCIAFNTKNDRQVFNNCYEIAKVDATLFNNLNFIEGNEVCIKYEALNKRLLYKHRKHCIDNILFSKSGKYVLTDLQTFYQVLIKKDYTQKHIALYDTRDLFKLINTMYQKCIKAIQDFCIILDNRTSCGLSKVNYQLWEHKKKGQNKKCQVKCKMFDFSFLLWYNMSCLWEVILSLSRGDTFIDTTYNYRILY